MHNSTANPKYLSWIKGSGLLLCLLFGLFSQPAFALFQNNLSCTATGQVGDIQLGELSPSQAIEVNMTANCRVTRRFPAGASLSHTQQYGVGTGPELSVFHVDSGQAVPNQAIGTASGVCMPSSCTTLTVGTTFSYTVKVSGVAAATPGRYAVGVNLTDTSVGFENFGDYLQSIALLYTVIQPACSMGSAKTINLAFGTLNSDEFANAQQVANVTMNCIRNTQATATLVPTQSAISGSPGVSATTLAGLSMAATWTDNDTAVTFNSPRTFSLTAGSNNIGLGFRPRLNTNVTPVGNFASQYTLNISYL